MRLKNALLCGLPLHTAPLRTSGVRLSLADLRSDWWPIDRHDGNPRRRFLRGWSADYDRTSLVMLLVKKPGARPGRG